MSVPTQTLIDMMTASPAWDVLTQMRPDRFRTVGGAKLVRIEYGRFAVGLEAANFGRDGLDGADFFLRQLLETAEATLGDAKDAAYESDDREFSALRDAWTAIKAARRAMLAERLRD